jgi:hypothetical protein
MRLYYFPRTLAAHYHVKSSKFNLLWPLMLLLLLPCAVSNTHDHLKPSKNQRHTVLPHHQQHRPLPSYRIHYQQRHPHHSDTTSDPHIVQHIENNHSREKASPQRPHRPASRHSINVEKTVDESSNDGLDFFYEPRPAARSAQDMFNWIYNNDQDHDRAYSVRMLNITSASGGT